MELLESKLLVIKGAQPVLPNLRIRSISGGYGSTWIERLNLQVAKSIIKSRTWREGNALQFGVVR
jgi:hypothetical protein